jgi:nuclear transport factor 2 (NTF2) superfamily protein
MNPRPPIPPFTEETGRQEVRAVVEGVPFRRGNYHFIPITRML